MEYRVEIDPKAVDEIDRAYDWLRARAPDAAADWFNDLYEAIGSLSDMPERCPLAPEEEILKGGIRQLLFGKGGRSVYRVLFSVGADVVRVLRIRHGARRPLCADDMEDSP